MLIKLFNNKHNFDLDVNDVRFDTHLYHPDIAKYLGLPPVELIDNIYFKINETDNMLSVSKIEEELFEGEIPEYKSFIKIILHNTRVNYINSDEVKLSVEYNERIIY